ncbi:MAG: SH3 domain-containing protein, partial [Chloroflexi bacterium]|nr:SH3 domain-containing protein [Chloroflexota bacterium]
EVGFSLPQVVEQQPNPGVNAAVGDAVQAPDQPVSCPGALAPRLTVGEQARVTFTDGQPLNVRNSPAGQVVTQIQEGTVMTVAGGPQCGNSILWWQVGLPNNLTGWAAEGADAVYFLEPLPTLQLATAQPQPQVTLQVATAPPLQVATQPQLAPTPTLQIIIAVNCPNSPPTNLAVGAQAVVIDNDGTLAVYNTPNTDIPTSQLPANTVLTVTGGPSCRDNGARMWQISTISGNISGWVSEGFGQTYFLQPQ